MITLGHFRWSKIFYFKVGWLAALIPTGTLIPLCHVTAYTQVRRIKIWTSLWGHSSACYSLLEPNVLAREVRRSEWQAWIRILPLSPEEQFWLASTLEPHDWGREMSVSTKKVVLSKKEGGKSSYRQQYRYYTYWYFSLRTITNHTEEVICPKGVKVQSKWMFPEGHRK